VLSVELLAFALTMSRLKLIRSNCGIHKQNQH